MRTVIRAILTASAFLYACWLTLLRRHLPEPAGTRGLKRRFLLATLLFVGFLTCVSCKKERATPTCYEIMIEPDELTLEAKTGAAMAAAWRALDPEMGDAFRAELAIAVSNGKLDQKAADVLKMAFAELAAHKKRTSGDGPKVTCYKMTLLGNTLVRSRYSITRQMELLDKAQNQGSINEETAQKAREAVARDLEMLSRSEAIRKLPHPDQRKIIDDYEDGKLTPGDAAVMAAGVIVEMQTSEEK